MRHSIFNPVKLNDLYTDWTVVTGLVLMLLGGANWVTGATKVARYNQTAALASREATSSARAFEELDQGKDVAVLEPLIAEQRKVSYATAHMDFYHVTVIAGRAMFAVGLAITLFAFLAAVRRDTRRAIERARWHPPDSIARGS